MLRGHSITLEPYTPEKCHEFWQAYVSDPAMWSETFSYDRQKIDQYYTNKVTDTARLYFAVCHQGNTVGEIQLKRIDHHQKYATLSVHLANDRCKNHGWGSEAIRLLTDYAFTELGLTTIYADTVHRNTRSQHVLEKLGFVFTYADDVLRYYKLQKPDDALSDSLLKGEND